MSQPQPPSSYAHYITTSSVPRNLSLPFSTSQVWYRIMDPTIRAQLIATTTETDPHNHLHLETIDTLSLALEQLDIFGAQLEDLREGLNRTRHTVHTGMIHIVEQIATSPSLLSLVSRPHDPTPADGLPPRDLVPTPDPRNPDPPPIVVTPPTPIDPRPDTQPPAPNNLLHPTPHLIDTNVTSFIDELFASHLAPVPPNPQDLCRQNDHRSSHTSSPPCV